MGESQQIEYKQSWRDEYLKWICGFANAQGGTIFIGVNDDGTVCGVDNAKKLMEDIPNKVRDVLGIVADVNLLAEQSKDYISITVKESSVPLTYRGKYYYRTGSTLQELGGLALNDFLMEKMNITWDTMTMPHATLDAIDEQAVEYFKRAAIRAKRLNESAREDSVEQVLQRLHLFTDDGKLTIAALLLFGKDICRWSATASFKIGRFGSSVADLIIQDVVECPLIMMPDRVIEILRSKYLVSPIHYEGLYRVEPLEIPEKALREMLCNAIVHKNYMGSYIQMRVWNDHITIWNEGTLPCPLTVEGLKHAHESKPRNKLIAGAFYLAGLIEAWGRGYEMINTEFANEGLQPPTFEELHGGMMATIQRERYLKMGGTAGEQINGTAGGQKDGVAGGQKDDTAGGQKDGDNPNTTQEPHKNHASTTQISGMTGGQKNDETGGQKDCQEGGQKTWELVLELIKEKPTITRNELSEKLCIAPSAIQKHIKKLKALSIIKRIGSDKKGYWEIVQATNQ